MKSTQEYREKIASLTQELANHKSKLAQETSTQEKESKLLRGRIQRMNEVLREAEKIQREEKSSFEQAQHKLDKSVLASNNEVKALHSEVSRLKNLLDLSRKTSNKDDWQAKTPRMKNSQQTVDLSKQSELQKELLNNIAAAEKASNDLKEYRSESEATVQKLQDKLQLLDEEKRKMEKELLDNKKLCEVGTGTINADAITSNVGAGKTLNERRKSLYINMTTLKIDSTNHYKKNMWKHIYLAQ